MNEPPINQRANQPINQLASRLAIQKERRLPSQLIGFGLGAKQSLIGLDQEGLYNGWLADQIYRFLRNGKLVAALALAGICTTTTTTTTTTTSSPSIYLKTRRTTRVLFTMFRLGWEHCLIMQ